MQHISEQAAAARAASKTTLGASLQGQTHVETAFRQYTADLLYEFNSYDRHFQRLDTLIAREDPTLRSALEADILAGEGGRFLAMFDASLADLAGLVAHFDKKAHTRHAFYFRNQVWPFIERSAILYRCNVRPRGYAGDSEMMRMMYANRYEGATLMAKLMHWHPLQIPVSQAVRNRRKLVAERIHQASQDRPNIPLRTMSLACGPACEVDDILRTPADHAGYAFVLLDHDVQALDQARQSIKTLEARHRQAVASTFVQASIMDLLGSAPQTTSLGRFDFIYSMGLFDYLSEKSAQRLARLLYDMLEPGGRLLVGNYHVDNPNRLYMEYWADWWLTYRNESDMKMLLSGCALEALEVGFEASGTQMFLAATRLR